MGLKNGFGIFQVAYKVPPKDQKIGGLFEFQSFNHTFAIPKMRTIQDRRHTTHWEGWAVH